jgi:two-component system, OmpR family, sensor histidine kinase KdpD
MMDEQRPKPDDLLRTIRQQEAKRRSGQLHVFFGMAAGVGKTYAMLTAARQRLRESVDVVIGYVETHGRTETESLLEGIPTVPRKRMPYRETEFEEMDLDAILKRKPALVLVDELAHTNIPGTRHSKRWQDVAELLDNGIDVYTTLNVQHIESRKEAVEGITGVTIRETVPDSMLERAVEVSLIDLTPTDLLQRLREGKVYLGDRAERAALNFFKEDRLTALREIALRITAEIVDNDLQQMTASQQSRGNWKPTERLMVAVSHSPYSEGLIRATRRLAFGLEAPWIAVNVDTGKTLSEKDRATLSHNLSLVRELGGEVVSTADTDIVAALQRVADQRHVTQMIIGRPSRRWLKDALLGGTMLDRLVRRSSSFDIHVLRPDKTSSPSKWRSWFARPWSSLYEYWWVLNAIAIVTLVSSFLHPLVGYRTIGFLLLLTNMVMSLFFSLGPILFGAIIGALIWDFLFIPPFGTFAISAQEDIIMCVAYLTAALITGTLTNRIRWRENMLRLREERTEALYDIVRSIVGARTESELATAVAEKIGTSLNGECMILLQDYEGKLGQLTPASSGCTIEEKEIAVAQWAFDNRKTAGWSTDTLPDASSLCVPLLGPTELVGVLTFRPLTKNRLLQEEQNLLSAVCRQVAVAIERDLFQRRSHQAEQLQQSERLHQTVLDSVSHEIRTPLTAIIGAASALQDENVAGKPEVRHELLQEVVETAERLDRVVDNLLDMSRLSSGSLLLKRDWHDVRDIISIAIAKLAKTLSRNTLQLTIPEQMPLVAVDLQLFEQVLSNILLNAASYAPSGSTIRIIAGTQEGSVFLRVCDEGQGVPEESLGRIFDKFYRLPGTQSGGTGLGLAVAKSVVEVHKGTIEAMNCKQGGLQITVFLPLEQQPTMPEERSS